jgi:hypothetical protein
MYYAAWHINRRVAMERYRLTYAKFRPACYNEEIAIGEQKEEIIEGKDLADADQKVKDFLANQNLAGQKPISLIHTI